MRPDRFRDFALHTYTAAGLTAQPWQDGARRPNGVQVTFPSGAQLWHAITCQSADGDDDARPEQPVEGPPAEPVPLPGLDGALSVPDAERYLAGLLRNTGSPEIADAYGYSAREPASVHPGFAVRFHSGARAFCVFVHVLRPGQREPGGEFTLPPEV